MLVAVTILLLTLALALWRPSVRGRRIEPAAAALLGALLMIGSGILAPAGAWAVARQIVAPVGTLLSLMTVALVAERAGLLGWLGDRIVRLARGDGRRLFRLIYLFGATFGMLLTNDTAVLLLTPLVLGLLARVERGIWSAAERMPFLFAVLYAGNLAGALAISNPVNLVVSHLFGIDFLTYAAWMFVPSATSLAVTWIGLEIAFRRELAGLRLDLSAPSGPIDRGAGVAAAIALGAILVALLTGDRFGPWAGALPPAIALALLAGLALARRPVGPILSRLNWDLGVFMFGIFVIAAGFRAAGLTEWVAAGLGAIGSESVAPMAIAIGFGASIGSALINNHPTAGIAAWVIQDLGLPEASTRLLVLAALVGSDLGPKMLPLGSLAAILWLGLLRQKGIEVSSRLYVRVGVPVTLAAVAASLATLVAEHLVFGQ